MENIRKYLNIRDRYIESRFSNLNEHQRIAALNTEGPEMILAGAGSGKTTVIINRIVNLLKFGTAYGSIKYSDDFLDRNVLNELDAWEYSGYDPTITLSDRAEKAMAVNIPKPWNILAITFTNKAANELKTRIAKAVGDDKAKDIQASTFHSLCAKILRSEYSYTAYSSHFTIYDTDDSKRLLKDIIKTMYGSDDTSDVNLDASTALDYISSFKDSMKTPEDIDILLEALDKSSVEYMYLSLYKVYQAELQKADAMDFGDLIMNTVELLRSNESVCDKYTDRYKYIMVDEYQDINTAQNALINTLAVGWFNVCIVGDEDQSIYGFRGAKVENILDFPRIYPSVFQVKLEQNYRSTKNIVELANSVIANNKDRYDKYLWTANDRGSLVTVREFESGDDEAEFIVDTIKRKGLSYKRTAILYRLNSQSSILEQIFIKNKIPYRIVGGLKFFDRKEVKDILAYLQILVNSNDFLRLKRIINVPARKIGASTVEKVEALANKHHLSMIEICRQADKFAEIKRSSKALGKFVDIYDELMVDLKQLSIADLIQSVYNITGYDAYLDSQSNADDRKLNINQLERLADSYEREHPDGSLVDFLEEISLLSDADDYDKDAECITMMTMHSSKGLEFDNVFLVGWADGIFPSARALQSDDLVKAIEEERRLAYVAITRAKKNLYITWADTIYMWGVYRQYSVSRFIKEFSDDNIRFEGTSEIQSASKSKAKYSKKVEDDGQFNLCIGDKVMNRDGKEFSVKEFVSVGNCHIVNIADSKGEITRVIWEYAGLLKL